jgi:hypothetical protein
MQRTAFTLGLCFVGFAAGCNPPNSEPTAGSESHFLTACVDTCAYGLSCRCGACTTGCTQTSDCAKFSPAAVCAQAAPADAGSSCEQAQTAPHCDAPCSSAGDCDALGSGYFCSRGYCRPDPLAQLGEPAPGFGLLCQQSTVTCETAPNAPSLIGTYAGQATVKLSSNALWEVDGTDTYSATVATQSSGEFSGTVNAPSVTLGVSNAIIRGNASKFTMYVSSFVDRNGCNLESRVVVSGTLDSNASPSSIVGGLALRFTGNYSGAACTQEQIDVYPDTGANFLFSATKSP